MKITLVVSLSFPRWWGPENKIASKLQGVGGSGISRWIWGKWEETIYLIRLRKKWENVPLLPTHPTLRVWPELCARGTPLNLPMMSYKKGISSNSETFQILMMGSLKEYSVILSTSFYDINQKILRKKDHFLNFSWFWFPVCKLCMIMYISTAP